MKVRGLDHIVINAEDADILLALYRDALGMEVLREDQFREGKVGFVSLRVSPETIVDIRRGGPRDKMGPNVDHFCLVLEDTDMDMLRLELKSKGVEVDDDVHTAWGAQGYGQQFKFIDPEGNKVDLRQHESAS